METETTDAVAPSLRARLRAVVSFLGQEAATAMVTTIALSIGFLIFNDYILPPPNLAGRWRFTLTYEDTGFQKFQDLRVTYQALLIQTDLEVKGTGEKMSAVSPTIPLEKYEADKRVHIELEGTIRRNYFSRDELVIHYKEAGRRRDSSTLHELEHFDPEAMCGCFLTTIADTTGTVWWERVQDRESLSDPVDPPPACADTRCS